MPAPQKPEPDPKRDKKAKREVIPPVLLQIFAEPGIDELKAKLGRPAIYAEELAAEVCERIAQGESITHICRDKHMPSRDTVHKWARELPEFADRLAHAREDHLEARAKQMMDVVRQLATDPSLDPQRARAMIDGIDKAARITKPRVPLVQENQTLVQNNYTRIDVSAMPLEARESLKRLLLAARQSGGGA
jgi:hypothetical protein